MAGMRVEWLDHSGILQHQVEWTRHAWEQVLWHPSNRRVACAPDAQATRNQQL